MSPRLSLLVPLAAVALLAPAAPAAANPGVKVPCLFHPTDGVGAPNPGTRSGVVTAGPWNAGGPLLGIEFFCTFSATADRGDLDRGGPFWWFTPGPVAVMPPMPASATGVSYLCTTVRYVAFASWSVYDHCAPLPEE